MINKILKPKSTEQIKKDLLYYIKSYNLKSFLIIIDIEIANALSTTCEKLNTNPKKMEICKPSSEFYENLLDWPFTKQLISDDLREFKCGEYIFEYSIRYKVIKYYKPRSSLFYKENPYYAFPKYVIPLLYEFCSQQKPIF